MLDNQVLDTIKRIIIELPDEGPSLDYKVNYHGYDDKYKKSEFIKDVCGFLNSIDAYKKDKFIIFGVSDDLHKVGIKKEDVIKDTNFQDMAEFISPRPSIITGTFTHDDGNMYGYIYIPWKLNNNHVYSINKDFPNVNFSDPDFPKYKIVHDSTSYIRSGSKNRFIQEEDRRSLYKLKYESISIVKGNSSNIGSTSILRNLSLIGSWNDFNKNDKEIISKYFNIKYEDLVVILKEMLINTPNLITYNKGIWNIQNKESLILESSKFYHEDDIKKFYEVVVEINKESNPKYDLNKNIRQFAKIYGKEPKYSTNIRISTLKTLIILKANESVMINAKSSIRNFEYNAIKDIIDVDNWKSIISSSDLLVYFAELSPDSYIDFVSKILQKKEIIKNLVNESEEGFFKKDYLTEIISGLLLTIQLDVYFIPSCNLLIKLSRYNEDVIDKLAMVFLPWHPQTMTSSKRRIIALKSMLQEDYEMTHKLVSKLLPGKTTLSYELPKFNYMFNFKYEEIHMKEYYDNQFDILKLACNIYKNNNDDIVELIGLTLYLNREMFEYMLKKVKVKINSHKSSKYYIWEYLHKFIIRYKKYHEVNASEIKKQNFSDLIELEKYLYDKKFEVLYYFGKNEWDLIDEFKQEKKDLLEKRQKIIKSIYENKGIKEILSISKTVYNSYAIGYTIASLSMISDEEKNEIRKNLDDTNEKKSKLASGFYKYLIENDLIDVEKECVKLSNMAKTNLLLQCKNELKTWKIVDKNVLNKKKYWTSCFIQFLDTESDVNYACKMKLKYKEYNETLNIIYNSIMDCIEFDMDYAYKSLIGILNAQENVNISHFTIQRIIRYLQEKMYDEEKLFSIEWSYMNIMDDDCRPITIEKMVATKPSVFIQLLCFAYKGAHAKKVELSKKENDISINAYSIINKCKIVPGNVFGEFNNNEFNKWIDEVIKLARDKDRTRVAKNIIGKILFYSPADKKLWINREIAKYINMESNEDVREGFNTNAFNSIGVINCDGTGSVFDSYADKYSLKAEELENLNLNNFAKSIRLLSESFRLHAQQEREYN